MNQGEQSSESEHFWTDFSFLEACRELIQKEWGQQPQDYFTSHYLGPQLKYYPEIENPGGLPCELDGGGWGTEDPDEECEPTLAAMVIENRNQAFSIYDATDCPGGGFSTQLFGPEEIFELVEFAENFNLRVYKNQKTRKITLSEAIASVGILFFQDGRECILPWNPQAWEQFSPEFFLPFELYEELCEVNSDNWTKMSIWKDWLETKISEAAAKKSRPLGQRDLIYNTDEWLPYQGLKLKDSFHFIDKPAIVFSVKEEFSPMLILNYLKFADESADIGKSLIRRRREAISSILRNYSLVIPNNKLQQTRQAIDQRNARLGYLRLVEKLSELREPFNIFEQTYAKRSIAVNALYGEFLQHIDAMQRPLPFFIEHPYKSFWRSSEILDRAKYSQELLNVFTKTPVFLALSQAVDLGIPNSTRDSMRKRLYKSPAADGDYVRFIRDLNSAAGGKLRHPALNHFASLFANDVVAKLEELVALRNRYHHAPFDCQPFIRATKEFAPQIIETYRKVFDGIDLILPISMTLSKDKFQLRVKLLMGTDSTFSETVIDGAPNPIENNVLHLYSQQTHAKCRLGEFFSHRSVATTSIDVGLFDRPENGQALYHYVLEI